MNANARDKLPEDPTELAKLADLTRAGSVPALLADFEKHTRETRSQFARIFAAQSDG